MILIPTYASSDTRGSDLSQYIYNCFVMRNQHQYLVENIFKNTEVKADAFIFNLIEAHKIRCVI